MRRRNKPPNEKGPPLPGQLSLFAKLEAAELLESRRLARQRDERVRAVKACFGWWNGRGRMLA